MASSTSAPHSRQVSMLMLNTRFMRCAQRASKPGVRRVSGLWVPLSLWPCYPNPGFASGTKALVYRWGRTQDDRHSE